MTIEIPGLDEAVAAESFSGVIAVYRGTERVFVRAEGFAHRAHAVPMTPDTRIAIASGSKMFTALAAMRLVERGVIELDAPIRPHLGYDLPLIDDAVTLRHLLTHTSGIGDYLDEENWDPADYVMTVPLHALAATEAFVPMLDGHPQRDAPGTVAQYNNGGLVVTALVIERASGTGYHELVEAEVIARAGLTRTAYLRSDDLPGDAALGYMAATGNHTNVLHLPVRGNGDGGAFTTADDVAQFWAALAAGRIVSAETLALMTTPGPVQPEEGERIGVGIMLNTLRDLWTSEGGDAGVSFKSLYRPSDGLTAVVLGNTSEGAWPVESALLELFPRTS